MDSKKLIQIKIILKICITNIYFTHRGKSIFPSIVSHHLDFVNNKNNTIPKTIDNYHKFKELISNL